jgi:hypothetical protein
MEILFNNFGKVLLLTIWLICGIVGFFKDPGALIIAGLATVCWAIGC